MVLRPAIDGWPNSMPGDGRDEFGDLFGFPARVQPRRHLSEAASAAFRDRAFHERLAPSRRGAVLAERKVAVRAHGHARLVLAVEGDHDRRHGEAEGHQHEDPERDRPLAGLRFGVKRAPGPAGASPHGYEEPPGAQENPEDDEPDDHAGGKISGATHGRMADRTAPSCRAPGSG